MIEHYELKITRSGDPLDRTSIARAESELGVQFPQPYVDLLLHSNGGVPSPAYIPYPGEANKIDRFYRIGSDGLVQACTHHRAKNGLPDHMLAVAELDGGDSLLLLQCAGVDVGALFFWVQPSKFGFRHNDPEYSNVARLYFTVHELAEKFGPAKNREDRDGMFCQLYYASSNPTHGPKLANKYAADGYDINFVLPSFRHPVFGAIDAEAYGVAAVFLRLGTRTTHVDHLHDNASVSERLLAAQEHWQGLLQISTENKYGTGIGMAKRHLAKIEEAISIAKAAG